MSIYFTAITATDALVTAEAAEADGGYFPNVGLGNQALIIDALGFTPDPHQDDYGQCDAADLRGRVLVAMALSPADEGIPVESTTTPRGARWHNMGRSEGYLHAKLAELLRHAEWCERRGYRVQWA